MIDSSIRSACVPSIVRDMGHNLANFAGLEYTITTAVLWTVVEQSLGIICARLPILRALLTRLGILTSKPDHASNFKAINSRSGVGIDLGRLSARPGLRPSIDISREIRVARLDKECGGLGLSTLTTHAGRMSSGDVPQVSNGILSGQTLEQHYDEERNLR